MDVVLYTSDRGHYLLVPACMQPTYEAEQLYGPLRPCAKAHLAQLREAALLARVQAEIDQHDYARVTPEESRALLGPRHACFRQPRSRFLTGLRRPRRPVSRSGFI